MLHFSVWVVENVSCKYLISGDGVRLIIRFRVVPNGMIPVGAFQIDLVLGQLPQIYRLFTQISIHFATSIYFFAHFKFNLIFLPTM